MKAARERTETERQTDKQRQTETDREVSLIKRSNKESWTYAHPLTSTNQPSLVVVVVVVVVVVY